MDYIDAVGALASVDRANAKLAQRAIWPWWRHAIVGVAMGVLVFGASQPDDLLPATAGIALAIIAYVAYDDRRRYGMSVSGFQGRRTKALAILIMLAALGLLFLSYSADSVGVAAGAGIAAFALTTAGSKWWEVLYRRELGEGAAK